MSESENTRDFFWNKELDSGQNLDGRPQQGIQKPWKKFKLMVPVVLLVFMAAFVGLQLWGVGKFRKEIDGVERGTRKLREKLQLLENTTGERNVFAFLDDVEFLRRECEEKLRDVPKIKRKWWFVLPLFKKTTVVQELSALQEKLSEIAAARPTIEAFARRLRETDTSIAGVMNAIETADAGSMVVEVASFIEDSSVLRKNIQRARWPSELQPYKEAFLEALEERDAALDALLAALASAAKASDFAEQAINTYITAWTIWDYQDVLNYIQASEEYSSQAEGYMAEFEFHTARYLKIRDRLIENLEFDDESSKGSKVSYMAFASELMAPYLPTGFTLPEAFVC